MRRLTALGAAWLLVAGLSGAAIAQGLTDVRLGNEAFRQGDYQAAVQHYTDAIRSGELVGEALAITYNNRGVAYGEAGTFDAAIADYSQAMALRPDDATTIRNLRVAHVRRGEVAFASGAYDAALDDFNRAIELEPEHHLAYQRRGELYLERGMPVEAAADLEHAALLSPGNPEIVAALDRAARQRGGWTSAEPEGLAEEPSIAEAPTAIETPPTAETPPVAESPSVAESEEPAQAAEAEAATAPAAEEPAKTETAETQAAEPAAPAEPASEPEQPAAIAGIAPEAQPGQQAAPSAPTALDTTDAAGAGERYRVVSAVNYRAGPDNSAERLGSVDAGVTVIVTGDTLGWKHVTLPGGERGFIYQRWLEPIDD